MVPDWDNQNRFFNYDSDCYKGEQLIVEAQAAEQVNMTGVECNYYVVDVNTKRDPIFKEDVLTKAVRVFKCMLKMPELPKLQKTYASEGSVVAEAVKAEFPLRHFLATSRRDENGTPNKYPERMAQVGDIVETLYNGVFYRVVMVNDVSDSNATQMFGNAINWQLMLRLLQKGKDEIKPENLTPGMEKLDKLLNMPDIHNDSKNTKIQAEKIEYKPKTGEKPANATKSGVFNGW